MDINQFLGHIRKSIQEKAASTPVSPLGVTPQNLMQFKAPLEKQTENMNPVLRQALGPITQVPSLVGENTRMIGRLTGLQPSKEDLANSMLMVLGGVKSIRKIPKGMTMAEAKAQAIRPPPGSFPEGWGADPIGLFTNLARKLNISGK